MRRSKTTLAAQLGITQQFLSRFLGIARSSITMFEMGHRNLPHAGAFKTGLLMQAFSSDRKPASWEGHAAQETAEVQQMLEKSIKVNEAKLYLLQAKLKKCCGNYAREANAMRTAGLLLESLPPVSGLPDEDQKWLENFEADARYRMQKYSKAVQANLQLKIEALDFEIAAAKKKLAELDSNNIG